MTRKRVDTHNVSGFLKKKKYFIAFIASCFYIAGIFYDIPAIAAWMGFCFAAYSVVANDSIQTLGTFIASNRNVHWWIMWGFISSVFLLTAGYSWYIHSGDVTFQRLSARGLDRTPTIFAYLQVTAPLFLLILTRLKIPVSTTFLILTCFTTSTTTVGAILLKSLLGYVIAFSIALVLWFAVSKVIKKSKKKNFHRGWRVTQWISTGSLWAIWLMQDASNVAVFLPRSLTGWEFTGFASVIIVGLGLLFFKQGEKIQEIVEEKSRIQDTRSATIVDFIYAGILYLFKIQNNIPMSTTWVFIGLLAGREIAKSLTGTNEKRELRGAIQMAVRDFSYVTIGLLVSMIIAVFGNETIRLEWLGF